MKSDPWGLAAAFSPYGNVRDLTGAKAHQTRRVLAPVRARALSYGLEFAARPVDWSPHFTFQGNQAIRREPSCAQHPQKQAAGRHCETLAPASPGGVCGARLPRSIFLYFTPTGPHETAPRRALPLLRPLQPQPAAARGYKRVPRRQRFSNTRWFDGQFGKVDSGLGEGGELDLISQHQGCTCARASQNVMM